MPRASSFCGVILAAGASSRMGRDKALLPWPPQDSAPAAPVAIAQSEWFPPSVVVASSGTFLSAQIELLRQFTDLVVVVAGDNAANLKPVVYSLGAFLVQNPDPARGQFSSLRIGVQEVLNRGRDAAIITLVDRPPAQSATVQRIREVFLASEPRQTWAVVPEYQGRHGHPICVGREMIAAFLDAPPTATARDVEHAAQAHIVYVPVQDPRITININTPDDYAALRNLEIEKSR